MNRTYSIKLRWLSALALFFCLPGLAATVYRTVDANGVVRFSDTRPAGDATVETLVVDDQAPQPDEVMQQRLQAMREISERMAADRMAREKHRAELRLLQAQLQVQNQNQNQNQSQEQPDNNRVYFRHPSTYFGYYNNPARRAWKRGHWWQPGHPVAAPSLQPPGQGQRPWNHHPNSGNDYPGSRAPRRHEHRVHERHPTLSNHLFP